MFSLQSSLGKWFCIFCIIFDTFSGIDIDIKVLIFVAMYNMYIKLMNIRKVFIQYCYKNVYGKKVCGKPI